MSRSLGAILICAASGLALWAVTPKGWGVTPVDGVLTGAVLYVAALRRFLEKQEVARPPRRGTLAFGVGWRAALFLALLGTQAYVCFEALPGVDVRRGFVVLSSWVIMLSLVDRGAQQPAWEP